LLGLSPTLVASLSQFTRALNAVPNMFALLLLDHSPEYCAHSAKLAVIKAITSLHQSTHELNMGVCAVCVSFIFACTVKYFFLYHNCSMTIFLDHVFSLKIFYKKTFQG